MTEAKVVISIMALCSLDLLVLLLYGTELNLDSITIYFTLIIHQVKLCTNIFFTIE